MTPAAFDVLVVGGGPAGSALSLRLARAGCNVAQLERTNFDSFRAGESIPPNAAQQLMKLGVWDQFLETKPSPVHGVQSAWGSFHVESSSFLTHPLLTGWHVDRTRFDRMLITSAMEAGAKVFTGTSALQVHRDSGSPWSAEGICQGSKLSLRARFLVDATGRSGNLLPTLGASRKHIDHLVGITVTTVPLPNISEAPPSLIESHRLGWWYSAGLPDGSLVVTLFTDADLCSTMGLTRAETFRHHLRDTEHTLQRLGAVQLSETLRVFPAGTYRLNQASGDFWLAIGDSVIGRDPLSSSGIDFALASAQRGYESLCAMANGLNKDASRYNEQIRSDFEAFLSQRNSYYSMEDRWSESPFWHRRQVRSIPWKH